MSAYGDRVLLRSNLISYWPLQEASGTLSDAKTTNHGTAHGSLTYRGRSDCPVVSAPYAITGNKTDAYVDVADVNALSIGTTGALSFICYAYIAASEDGIFIGKNGTNYEYALEQSTGPTLDGVVFTNGGGNAAVVPSASISTGWHQLGITMDSASPNLALFVDGAAFGTPDITWGAIANTTALLNFLRRGDAGATWSYSSGSLAHVSVYSAALAVGSYATDYSDRLATSVRGVPFAISDGEGFF